MGESTYWVVRGLRSGFLPEGTHVTCLVRAWPKMAKPGFGARWQCRPKSQRGGLFPIELPPLASSLRLKVIPPRPAFLVILSRPIPSAHLPEGGRQVGRSEFMDHPYPSHSRVLSQECPQRSVELYWLVERRGVMGVRDNHKLRLGHQLDIGFLHGNRRIVLICGDDQRWASN